MTIFGAIIIILTCVLYFALITRIVIAKKSIKNNNFTTDFAEVEKFFSYFLMIACVFLFIASILIVFTDNFIGFSFFYTPLAFIAMYHFTLYRSTYKFENGNLYTLKATFPIKELEVELIKKNHFTQKYSLRIRNKISLESDIISVNKKVFREMARFCRSTNTKEYSNIGFDKFKI